MSEQKKIVARLDLASIYHQVDPYKPLTAKNFNNNGELVLSDVTLEFSAGDFVYFVGKTGSGKSTLLRTFYGDVALLSGKGSIVGFPLHKLRKKDIPFLRRKIGVIFQENFIQSELSVYDNLLIVLEATGWSDKKKMNSQIRSTLELVGLKTRAHRMPYELSAGERQRLVIARSLLNSPEVILADEPTLNLDPVTTNEIMDLLRDIAQKGTCVIMSTHNTSILEDYPGRTILFQDGRATEVNL